MAFTFVNWTAATRCTGSAGSGAAALMRYILRKHPKGRSLGIYNCRTVRGGSTTSKHGEGRALDVGFPMDNGRGSAAGYALVKQVGAKGRELGVECIIYDRKIWSNKSPGGRYYGGAAPHYDHVHIELSREAARELTEDKVNRILGGHGLTARQRMRIRRLRRYIKLWQAKIVELQAREARLRKRIEEGTINRTKAENRIALIRRNARTYRRKIADYEARIRRIQNA